MDVDVERIRLRAYEIWDREGRTGDPQEHWFRAQSELIQEQGGPPAATLEGATPAQSARAADAVAAPKSASRKKAATQEKPATGKPAATRETAPATGKAPAARKAPLQKST